MSDVRKFKCEFCDTPCFLIMEGMGVKDDEEIELVCCPYDGTRLKNYWKEVKDQPKRTIE